MSRPPSLTDDEVLQRARVIFAERGYGARTADVAAAVGLSWPALVFRFGGKAELFRRAMADSICAPEAADWLRAGASGVRGMLEQLGTYLLRRWPIHLQRRLASKVSAQGATRDADLDQVADWLCVTLDVLAARGKVRSDVPANTLAQAVLSLLIGEAARRLIDADTSATPDADLLDGVARLVAPCGTALGRRSQPQPRVVPGRIDSRAETSIAQTKDQ